MDVTIKKNIFRILVLMLFVFVFFTDSQAQTPKDRIIKVNPWTNSPIEITSLSSNAGTIRSEESFIANETWLQGLSLRIKNISKKTIIGIRYTLLLPKLEGKKLPLGVSIEYGQTVDEENMADESAPIPPGGTVVLSLPEDTYNDIIFNVQQTGSKSMSNVSTAILILQEVRFDDGTRWMGGNMLSTKQDKTNTKQAESTTSNMVFCGQVSNSTTVTCCRNSRRGCFSTVSRITLTQTTGTGVGICSSFFICRCDMNVECQSQFTYSCEGPIFDCGLSS